MNIDPVVARWALDRIHADRRHVAALAECRVRYQRGFGAIRKEERVLRAEPISAAIGLTALIETIIGGTAITILGASVSAASIGGAIVGVGLSIGLNYLASTMQRSGTGSVPNYADSALNTPAIKYNERQAIPAKRIIFGSAQVGGALFFERVKPPYLYQGLLVSARRITALRKLWLGTQEISFAQFAPNMVLTPLPVTGLPNYPDRLKVSVRLGDRNQTVDPLLHADFPNLDVSFRQRGIATLVLRYHYGANFEEFQALWGQVQRPNPLVLADGVPLPDPRVPGHILRWNPDDPESVAEAEASWSYSNNAALVQTYYLTQRFGGRIHPDRIVWDKVAEAANWDDGLIGCLDGAFIRRHTIDGIVTLNQSPSSVLSGMLSANRGFILESAGKSWVSSSAPRAPIATIHDRILTGAIDYRAAKPKRDLVNRVKSQFIAEDREYQTTVGPVLTRPDLEAVDGELLEATLNLPFTMDHRRVQRLEKAYLDTARLGAQLTVRCDVELLANCAEDPVGNSVNVDSQLFRNINGVWFVSSWGFADGFSAVDLALTKYDPSIETAYTAATDERPFTLAELDVS